MTQRALDHVCCTARSILSLFLIVISLSLPGWAEERKRNLWKISLGVLAAASIADAGSSWNRSEANPLLQGPNGRFSGQGIALKGALAGSVVLSQWLVMRKQPRAERAAAFTNFALAGVLGAAAVHNVRQQHSSALVTTSK
jgi:tellurite resistance protein TehA-like permease